MRRPSKREAVLIGLMVGAVVFTISLDANVKHKKDQNRRLRSQNQAQATESGQGPRNLAGYVPGRMKAGAVADYWGLDPFDRPFTRDAVGEDGGRALEKSNRIKLDGVMITSHGAAAMINKMVYREGDTVGRFSIDSISRTEVVVRNIVDGTTTRLKVE